MILTPKVPYTCRAGWSNNERVLPPPPLDKEVRDFKHNGRCRFLAAFRAEPFQNPAHWSERLPGLQCRATGILEASWAPGNAFLNLFFHF